MVLAERYQWLGMLEFPRRVQTDAEAQGSPTLSFIEEKERKRTFSSLGELDVVLLD